MGVPLRKATSRDGGEGRLGLEGGRVLRPVGSSAISHGGGRA